MKIFILILSLFLITDLHAAEYVDRFGAKGDGKTDDTAAINAALRAAGAGGTAELSSGKRYKVLGNIIIPASTTLDCNLARPEDGGGNNPDTNLDKLGGIALSPSATIFLGGSGTASSSASGAAGIQHCFVFRNGMIFPASSASDFAGVAITAVNPSGGAFARDVLVIGFNVLFDGLAGGRIEINRFNGDGVNGIILANSFDKSLVRDVHLFPYATITFNKGKPPNDILFRTGSGLSLEGHCDETLVDGYYALAYKIGASFGCEGNLQVGSSYTDDITGAAQKGSVGTEFINNLTTVQAANVMAFSSETPVLFRNQMGTVNIGNLTAVWSGANGNCVTQKMGNVIIANFEAAFCGLFAIDYENPDRFLKISHAHIYSMSGSSSAANIKLAVGANNEMLKITTYTTDDFARPLFGGVQLQLFKINSAAVVSIPGTANSVSIFGSSAISTIHGGYGGREVTFVFTGAASIVCGGNVALARCVPFLGVKGAAIHLLYDPSLEQWREEWRSAP